MIQHFIHLLSHLSTTDRILFGLVVAITFFFILSVVFAVLTLAVHIRRHRQAGVERQLEAAWTKTLIGVLNRQNQIDDIYALVSRRNTLQFLDFLARFARRVVGEERERIQFISSSYIRRILPGVRSRNPEKRALAVKIISELNPSDFKSYIAEALDDSSQLVAMIAAHSLIYLRDLDSFNKVLDRLNRFSAWDRNFIASMLASVGAEVGQPLREYYADDQREPYLRSICAEALHRLNDLQTADVAQDVILKSDNRDLLCTSLRLLKTLGRPEHAPAIRKLLTTKDDIVLAHALGALGALGDLSDESRLSIGLDHPSPWVASHAAEGLKALGCQEYLRRVADSGHPRSTLVRHVLAEAD